LRSSGPFENLVETASNFKNFAGNQTKPIVKTQIAASFGVGKLKIAALQGGGAEVDRPFPIQTIDAANSKERRAKDIRAPK